MPAAAALMLFLAALSIPFGLAGPAGIAAGALALVARHRFLRIEAATPGHRGARATGLAYTLSLAGMAVGTGMTILIVALATGLIGS